MPNLKDAAVAVAGQIMDVERLENYETKKYDGLRVVIATGDGFAQVKLSIEDAAAVAPEIFGQVAWVVRFGAYANKVRQSDAQTTCRFVSVITPDFLDRLVSASGLAAAASK